MLMGYGDLQLPYDVPANEYLTLEGRKFSSSRNWAIWAPDYLSRYDPDPIRYYLTTHAPENSDSDFSWAEFLAANNNELLGTWGNLAHRILTFAYRNFEGRVPEPGVLTEEDRAIIATTEGAFAPVAADIEACRFRSALAAAMAVAREANRYLDTAAPWKALKVDRQRAATIVYVTLRVVDSLKTLLSPFVPFSSERLHAMLGYAEPLFGTQQVVEYAEVERRHLGLTYHTVGARNDLWRPSALPAGQPLGEPTPLIKKLDESIVEQELARLG